MFIQHGINVPEQVIVTGFDGIDEIYYSMPNKLGEGSSRRLADTVFKAVKNAVSGVDIQDRYTVEPSLYSMSPVGVMIQGLCRASCG